jgi:phosphate/sulfate permease
MEPQWYHALAPLILLALTRVGIPVSTTFLVLSAFASTFVLEKMLVKSIVGYAIAAVIAYGLWFVIERFIDEKADKVKEKNINKKREYLTSEYIEQNGLQGLQRSNCIGTRRVTLTKQRKNTSSGKS